MKLHLRIAVVLALASCFFAGLAARLWAARGHSLVPEVVGGESIDVGRHDVPQSAFRLPGHGTIVARQRIGTLIVGDDPEHLTLEVGRRSIGLPGGSIRSNSSRSVHAPIARS